MAEVDEKKRRGRPRSAAAASHDAILGAVYDLLHEKSVRDLTIEEIARRAGVGKPTIYKWWPSKAALVMDMLDEHILEDLPAPGARSAEEAIRSEVTELVRRFNGFPGKVAMEILAEGQSDPGVLQEYRDRYLSKRRAVATEVIERAQASGEFRKDIVPVLQTAHAAAALVNQGALSDAITSSVVACCIDRKPCLLQCRPQRPTGPR